MSAASIAVIAAGSLAGIAWAADARSGGAPASLPRHILVLSAAAMRPTLRWVESLGSEEEYAPVLADLFLRWMDRSARDATAALLKYPRGPGRDHALRRLVHERLSVFDTGTAERFLEAIDSPAERRLAAERLHRYYMEVDPNERKAAEFARLAATGD